MAEAHTGEITRLLAAVKRGDPDAESNLISLVYDEFRVLARNYMRRERPGHTLQPTALVHEAYIRLVRNHAPECADRAHFFAAASLIMRRILVDHARRRSAVKRRAGHQVELDDFMASASPRLDHLLMIDEALTRLAAWNKRQARLVELMYFGGLNEEEAAEVLGISVRTVKRDWSAARAWLQAQLRKVPQ